MPLCYKSEVPQEEYDSRCLYDRLKEQRDKKQDDWDEAHKLKNMVRGLDDDEVGFLELVDKTKLAEESRILKEEKNELEEYRKAVRQEMDTQSVPIPKAGNASLISPKPGIQSQRSKIIACVKRKSVVECTEVSKRMKPEIGKEKTKEDKTTIALPGIGIYDGSSNSDTNTSSDSD